MKSKKIMSTLIVMAFVAFMMTCASKPVIQGTPKAGSKFSKVQLGMAMQQVYDTIGAPTDSHTYATGKAWIPFYFGGDTVRTDAIYKGEGKLTFTRKGGAFSSAMSLHIIHVDTNEDGYK